MPSSRKLPLRPVGQRHAALDDGSRGPCRVHPPAAGGRAPREGRCCRPLCGASPCPSPPRSTASKARRAAPLARSIDTTTATPSATPRIDSASCHGWRPSQRRLARRSRRLRARSRPVARPAALPRCVGSDRRRRSPSGCASPSPASCPICASGGRAARSPSRRSRRRDCRSVRRPGAGRGRGSARARPRPAAARRRRAGRETSRAASVEVDLVEQLPRALAVARPLAPV